MLILIEGNHGSRVMIQKSEYDPSQARQRSGGYTRRNVLRAFAGASLLAVVNRDVSAASTIPRVPPPPIRFGVFRSGDVIGSHHVDFDAAEDGGLAVTTRIEIEVRILAVKAFEFFHRSTELWRGGWLRKFDSETLDDGSRFFVNGHAAADGFQITHRKGSELAPADIMVGSYWTPEIARRNLLIDPQRGSLREQTLLGEDTVALPIGGGSIQAIRYTLVGLTKGWVAYDERGRWLAAQLTKKNSDIFYVLRP